MKEQSVLNIEARGREECKRVPIAALTAAPLGPTKGKGSAHPSILIYLLLASYRYHFPNSCLYIALILSSFLFSIFFSKQGFSV